jgi:hypothetical protein
MTFNYFIKQLPFMIKIIIIVFVLLISDLALYLILSDNISSFVILITNIGTIGSALIGGIFYYFYKDYSQSVDNYNKIIDKLSKK